MKKTAFLLCLFLLAGLLLPVQAGANSAPLDDNGTQSAEMFTVDENSPITVELEALTLDYRNLRQNSSYGGQITAAYQMHNPTDTEQTVKMAFPFISNPKKVLAGNISIMCESAYLPWEYYRSENSVLRRDMLYTSFVEDHLNINNILDTIEQNHEPYSPSNFDLQAEGFLYSFENLSEQGISIRMEEKYRAQSIFNNIIVNNFAHTESSYTSILYAGITACDIFSLNGPIEYTVFGSCKETSSRMTLEEYLEDFRGEFWISHGHPIQNLRSYWLKELDASLAEPHWYARGQLYRTDEDYDIFVNLMVYTVTFPPRSTKNVSVSYPSALFISTTRDGPIEYEETYILNPARYWADFKGLDITVYTPHFASHVVNSTLPLTKSNPNTYTAHFDSLPNGDLTFSLYANPELPIYGLSQSQGRTIIIILSLVACTIPLLVWLVGKWRTRRRRS